MGVYAWAREIEGRVCVWWGGGEKENTRERENARERESIFPSFCSYWQSLFPYTYIYIYREREIYRGLGIRV